jgi:hypothetical protein
VDKFSDVELESLRTDLMQSGLDAWQAAELVSTFLASRGYGVSRENAYEAVGRMESQRCSIASLGDELEKLALMM